MFTRFCPNTIDLKTAVFNFAKLSIETSDLGCSSKTPVDMEDVLYDRSGQYITDDNYDPSFLGFMYNQKVYNGPGFLRYRTGEKREQGTLKNGFKSGAWTGYDKEGNIKFDQDRVLSNDLKKRNPSDLRAIKLIFQK